MAAKKDQQQPDEGQQQAQDQQDQQDQQQDQQGQGDDERKRVESNKDNATLLLAAAEELDLDPGVVTVDGGYLSAPARVVEKAGVDTVDDDADKPRQGTVADASDDDAVAANASESQKEE